MNSEVESYIRNNIIWSKIPSNVKQVRYTNNCKVSFYEQNEQCINFTSVHFFTSPQ